MTRKDFVALAEAVAQITDPDERKRTAELVGIVCKRNNGRFDWQRWNDACNTSPER